MQNLTNNSNFNILTRQSVTEFYLYQLNNLSLLNFFFRNSLFSIPFLVVGQVVGSRRLVIQPLTTADQHAQVPLNKMHKIAPNVLLLVYNFYFRMSRLHLAHLAIQ